MQTFEGIEGVLPIVCILIRNLRVATIILPSSDSLWSNTMVLNYSFHKSLGFTCIPKKTGPRASDIFWFVKNGQFLCKTPWKPLLRSSVLYYTHSTITPQI